MAVAVVRRDQRNPRVFPRGRERNGRDRGGSPGGGVRPCYLYADVKQPPEATAVARIGFYVCAVCLYVC